MNTRCLNLVVFLAASLLSTTTRADLYVAPDGNDANPGTQQQPLATLQRARDVLRQNKQRGDLDRPTTVWLRGGWYTLREPIEFSSKDSGTADAPITYASLSGERAVLSGGVRLAGSWQAVPGKPYWQLSLPPSATGGWDFHSLFINGQSRMRARYPNFGEKVLRAEGREAGGDPRQALQYFPGDVDPAWSHPNDMDVVLLCSWTPTIHRIAEIVPEKRSIRFHSTHNRSVDFWERNFRYYLSNVFEALDQPGEWYLDRHQATLYYYPLPGEDLQAAEVIVPVLKSRLLVIAGDPDQGHFVEHLHFRDLEFRHVDGDMDRYNGVYRQGHMYLAAAIAAQGLRHASFERCELAQLGEYALELADGCRDVTIRQCHIWDLGAGGLQLGVTDLRRLREGEQSDAQDANSRAVDGLVIDNNCIHRLGTIWHGCYGIVNRFACNTKITHNDIYDVHWDAIGLDARWTWKGEKYSHGNVIAYNHLHHLGLGYHTDAAGVYQFGPLDTHIHHNLIHDAVAYPYICGYAGIYLDEQSRGALVENNLVYNVDWYAYFQHKGTDNTFRNNLGAFARDGFIGRGSLNNVWRENYMQATNNVYIAKDNVAIRRGWEPGDKPPVLAKNMYHTLAHDGVLTFDGQSLEQWQAAGHDQGSIIADPGCRNPAEYDFSLASNATACQQIGFVPIQDEIAKTGLYGDQAWRETPDRYPPRKPSAVWQEEDFTSLAGFDLDLNVIEDGVSPGVFSQNASNGAGFVVTREVVGVRGPKCLKCTDKQGLAKSFYPYLHTSPKWLKRGRIVFTFAVRQPAAAAARMNLEFRGPGGTKEPGPAIAIGRDHAVQANGKRLLTMEPDTWTRFELRFGLGDLSDGTYQLTVDDGDQQTAHTLPFGNTSFKQISWIGITMSDDADGIAYLDDLKLKVTDE